MTQTPVTSCAGHLIQATNKTQIQTQSSADGTTTSFPLPIRGNQQAQRNLAQFSPYKKFTQTIGPNLEGRNQKEERIQPASRKEFNFPWSLGKETSSTITLKKKKWWKGREILHKWRDKLETQSPNKWRGNRQTTRKRIQNNDSKDDKNKNLENKIKKMQESINKDL